MLRVENHLVGVELWSSAIRFMGMWSGLKCTFVSSTMEGKPGFCGACTVAIELLFIIVATAL